MRLELGSGLGLGFALTLALTKKALPLRQADISPISPLYLRLSGMVAILSKPCTRGKGLLGAA